MKMNKEKFLKTELGGSLKECITSWDIALENCRRYSWETDEWKREKKRRRQYFIMQKLSGIALLAFTALAVYILEGDATIAVFTVPLALYMICSREMCIVNRYYWETKERETYGR